jgi:hypothetical protein
VVFAVSTPVAILGWILVVLGLVCLVAGIFGLIRTTLTQPAIKPQGWTPGLGEVITALLGLGAPGVLCALGIVLLIAGGTLLGIKVFQLPS